MLSLRCKDEYLIGKECGLRRLGGSGLSGAIVELSIFDVGAERVDAERGR